MSLRNPVKYPVKYYTWQDAQAPQLANADGVIKTILKACLVTGYGGKAGAGWTSLFEDDYRIVLRRPLRTGNPPDIKIENGTITGTTVRHSIVAQNNPVSIDDNNSTSSVQLLAKNNSDGEWHLFASDFAFMMCYHLSSERSILYCGEVSRFKDIDSNLYIVTTGGINGIGYNTYDPSYSSTNFLNGSISHIDMIKNNSLARRYLDLNIAELDINNDYSVQKIILGEGQGIYPFFTSLATSTTDLATKQVSIANRNFLRYVHKGGYYSGSTSRAFYIPLDYWEL